MNTKENAISLFSPAKVNLFLSINGLRSDGFHDLTSLVAPLNFGDDIQLSFENNQSNDILEGDLGQSPKTQENLIFRAITYFRKKVPALPPVKCILQKRIPTGAGLGGGSSNAAMTLKGLNYLMNNPFSISELMTMASDLGSDCALFFVNGPSIMEGRGECITPISKTPLLQSLRLLLFKPEFSIPTSWVYTQMKAAGDSLYNKTPDILISSWLERHEMTLFNNLEKPVFTKYVALPTMINELRERFESHCLMSGSGSACFMLLKENDDVVDIISAIREAWGQDTFIQETSLL